MYICVHKHFLLIVMYTKMLYQIFCCCKKCIILKKYLFKKLNANFQSQNVCDFNRFYFFFFGNNQKKHIINIIIKLFQTFRFINTNKFLTPKSEHLSNIEILCSFCYPLNFLFEFFDGEKILLFFINTDYRKTLMAVIYNHFDFKKLLFLNK